jgi:hypothetical protein
LLDTLDLLAPPGRFGKLRDLLAEQAADGAGAQPDLAAVLDELSRARERIEAWPLGDASGATELANGFRRIYRRGRQASSAAQQNPTMENLHELRKRGKDLWHATQLVHECQPRRAALIARRAHELSDLLGEEHDLAILRERAVSERSVFGPGELELLETRIERRRKRLRRKALSRAARLYRRKPRTMVRRLALI